MKQIQTVFWAVLSLALWIAAPYQARAVPLDGPAIVIEDYQHDLASGRVSSNTYSEDSRKIMEDRAYSRAQMEAEAKSLETCGRGEEVIQGSYAVVRFPGKLNCPPYFLVLENNRWTIDESTMSIAVKFGAENKWHFAGDPHSIPYYAFAFDDWAFDPNGYYIQ